VLTTPEIAELIAEPKPLACNAVQILLAPRKSKRKGVRRDRRAKVFCEGAAGHKFEITVRLSEHEHNPHDFSVLVRYHPVGTRPVLLLRCNGWHAPHDNQIEKRERHGIRKIPANTFHVHRLTERYQRFGKPDGYAEPTDEYGGFQGAVEFVCENFGFYLEDDPYGRGTRRPLFHKGGGQ
jgi:hypothetical protein